MKQSDIPFLNQLVKSLEESFFKLEEAYKNNDQGEFERIKQVMIKIQQKISEVIR